MGIFPQPESHSLAAQGSLSGSLDARSLTRSSSLREIPDEELKKFCSRVSKLLQKEDVGPEAIDALQRLFLIVSATKYSRR